MEEVCNLMHKELHMLHKNLQHRFSFPDHMPPMAVRAHWARALKRSIAGPIKVSPPGSGTPLTPPLEHITANLVILLQVLKKASFMPDSGISISLSQTMHLLDETERSSYSEWSQNLDAQYLQRLEQPLIMRCRDNQAKLDINFDG